MPDFEGKPIRMRGYYRAVKRKVPWAIKIANLEKKSIFSFLLALTSRNVNIKEAFMPPNPFLSPIPKDGGFAGKYIPVPLRFKEDK